MKTLPSDPQPAEPAPPGLTLAPFRGVRYDPDRVADLAKVTSPPYDVIGPDTVEHLLSSEPHNVVRIILPEAGAARAPDHRARQDRSRANEAAARTLGDWLSSGVLIRDAVPALYVYEQRVPAGPGPAGAGPQAGPAGQVIQRGLIGALRLVPPSARRVLPHEDVMPGPVTGRRGLMEATQANLEPIFVLYGSADGDDDGPADNRAPGSPDGAPDSPGDRRESGSADGGASRSAPEGAPVTATQLVEQTASREPLIDTVTDDGVRHRLWAVTSPREHAMVAADLAARQALIADGHHRYAAYLDLQARRHAAGGGAGPWDYGLAFLVDAAAYPPRIGAIHRVVPGLEPARAAEMAKSAFSVRAVPGGPDAALRALADAGDEGPAFVLAGGGEHYLLTDPDAVALADAMPPERSPRWRGLGPSVMRELLIGSAWKLQDAEPDVLVVHDAASAAVAAADQVRGTAVLCNPVTAEDVSAVAAGGERVPRKSTSFGPKPRTGFVIRTFDADT